MKAKLLIILCFGLTMLGCSDAATTQETQSNIQETTTSEDSLKIIQSPQFKRIVAFLNWYKAGFDSLSLHNAVNYEPKAAELSYINDLKAQKLLNRFRNSGFFSEGYLQADSLFFEQIKKDYVEFKKMKTIDPFDPIDHDFILQTQETDSVLADIPARVKIVPKECNLELGKISVLIGTQGVGYHMVYEHGLYRLNKIN